MSSSSSMLLLFGLLLILPDLTASTGPKWEDFKRSHIARSPAIVCSVTMPGPCQETQSFIHTYPRNLENICKGITGMKNVRSIKEFTVSTCTKHPNTTCSYGEAQVRRGVICLTCRNRKPVQYVRMGGC